jgi:hypothetical protein
MSGLPVAKSGVKNEPPNTLPGLKVLASLTELEVPEGLAVRGWLRMLKASLLA